VQVAQTSKARTRKAQERRSGSVASSTADELARRTRSHSVSTAVAVEPISEARPDSRDQVKHEPSTPAEVVDAPDHLEPSATPVTGGRMTRTRRGTLQSQQQSTKRKRQQSTSAASEDNEAAAGTLPPRSNTVLASRRLAKTAGSLLSSIGDHRLGNTFKGPVNERQASGYSDIVKQPQNLRAIGKAVEAGKKAIAAATATMDSPSAVASMPAGKGNDVSTVELERSLELIPPRAIVNGTQLEKEVYKMLANAVMFNPGEDGLVAQTREMFEDVEAKIKEWRGVEAGGEDEEEGKGKRRKL
jgi:hypothetical protein